MIGTDAQVLLYFLGFFPIFATAWASAVIIYRETRSGRRTGCGGQPTSDADEKAPRTWFDGLPLPSLTPPGWFFALVGAILYAGETFVIWAYLRELDVTNLNWRLAVGFFAAQLLTSLGWAIILFNYHRVRAACITVVLSLGLNVTGLAFGCLYKGAALLAAGNEYLLTAVIIWSAVGGWQLIVAGFNMWIWAAVDAGHHVVRVSAGGDEQGDDDSYSNSTSTSRFTSSKPATTAGRTASRLAGRV
jgi:tryptophan-rich sensory protein